jgi:hypothetical protein
VIRVFIKLSILNGGSGGARVKGWFDVSLIHSGELIKKSKPSSDDLKQAHKKLSDLHTKFEVFSH